MMEVKKQKTRNQLPVSPLSSQQRPHVVSQQDCPQLAQRQSLRGGCVGSGVQCGAVKHHTTLPLTERLQVIRGSSCQNSPEGRSPVDPHPEALTHHFPAGHWQNPAPPEGQDSGHHCRWDLVDTEVRAVVQPLHTDVVLSP